MVDVWPEARQADAAEKFLPQALRAAAVPWAWWAGERIGSRDDALLIAAALVLYGHTRCRWGDPDLLEGILAVDDYCTILLGTPTGWFRARFFEYRERVLDRQPEVSYAGRADESAGDEPQEILATVVPDQDLGAVTIQDPRVLNDGTTWAVFRAYLHEETIGNILDRAFPEWEWKVLEVRDVTIRSRRRPRTEAAAEEKAEPRTPPGQRELWSWASSG